MSGLEQMRAVVLAHGPASPAGRVVGELMREGLAPERILLVHNPPRGSDSLEREGVELAEPELNLGYAGGMNLGIRRQLERAGGPNGAAVLLATHDIELAPGAIAELAEALERDSGLGVVAPVLEDLDSGATFSSGVTVTGLYGIRHEVGSGSGPQGIVWPRDAVDGALLLIRGEVLAEVGLLDESLFMYFEETDFCFRARRAGWGVGVASAARARQRSGQWRRPASFGYLIARNGLIFARRHGGWTGVVKRLLGILREVAILVWFSLLPHKPAAARRAARWRARGTIAGIVAFARDRRGPPPRSFAAADDVLA